MMGIRRRPAADKTGLACDVFQMGAIPLSNRLAQYDYRLGSSFRSGNRLQAIGFSGLIFGFRRCLLTKPVKLLDKCGFDLHGIRDGKLVLARQGSLGPSRQVGRPGEIGEFADQLIPNIG